MTEQNTITILFDRKNKHFEQDILKLQDLLNTSKSFKILSVQTSNDESNDNTIVVFTDGACSSNGKSKAKAGIGIYIENTNQEIAMSVEEVSRELSIESVKPTNNVAELLAILKALNMFKNEIKDGKKIVIKTDSMYSINSLTKWFKNWQKNNWRTGKDEPVLNQNIIKRILELTCYKNVSLQYVKAHSINPDEGQKSEIKKNWFGNNKADLLAKQNS